jgi:tRNA threonylcarbamoyladenosine biosynthesis protein TsaE
MILADERATVDLAARIAPALRAGDVILLSGGLGVGKTTFARAILGSSGHQGEVPSPSFAIVQPYEHLSPPVWHADLYRITDSSELLELGLDDVADAVLLVEWPERAGSSAWPDALRLTLSIEPDGRRRLTAQVSSAWEGRWPPR